MHAFIDPNNIISAFSIVLFPFVFWSHLKKGTVRNLVSPEYGSRILVWRSYRKMIFANGTLTSNDPPTRTRVGSQHRSS
jgi:hypothetical protein